MTGGSRDSAAGRPAACRAARRAMHARLDGPARVGAGDGLDAHLAGCAACREDIESYLELARRLRDMPVFELDDGSVRSILLRTVGADDAFDGEVVRSSPVRRLLSAAVAAALLLAAAVVTLRPPAREPQLDATGLDRAMDDVRLVLGLTSDGLNKSRDAAFRSILEEELAPALRRLPLFGGVRPAEEERDS